MEPSRQAFGNGNGSLVGTEFQRKSFMCRLQKERPLPQGSNGRGNMRRVLNEGDCVVLGTREASTRLTSI